MRKMSNIFHLLTFLTLSLNLTMREMLINKGFFIFLLLCSCLTLSKTSTPNKVLRFAFQADIHNFNRIPEAYLRKMLSDAKQMNCDFIAWLGDVMDGDEPNPLKLTISASIPIIYQHGDHELFNEWGRTGFRNYESFPPNGEKRNDPLVFFRGSMPRQEALTLFPTGWSSDLKGIHFIVCFNGKDIVWYPWFLHWLEEDLRRAKDKTTILLSHRPLNDAGETAEAMRKIVEKFPSVRLYCYGHTHSSAPFFKIGNALCVNAEANSPYHGKSYEGNWYVIVEITKDSIRIFRRIMEKKQTILLWEEKASNSLKPISGWKEVNMAFLMSDKSFRFIPFLRLRKAKMRIYGVKAIQVLDKDKANLKENAKMKSQMAEGTWRELGIDEVLGLDWEGRDTNDWVELARWEVPVRFEGEPERVGEAGTLGEGTVYMPLLLVKGRKGDKVKLLIECLRTDGSLESRHWVEGILGEGITALWALTGHIKFNPPNPFWRWMGVEGKTEVDDYKEPRRAVKMRVAFLSQPREKESFEIVAFLYPTEAFFTPLPKGEWYSEDVKVRIGEKVFAGGNLAEGETREFSLGELQGGEEIAVQCKGSKLALIEVRGETDKMFGGD
jgi:predicted phosphodiesterase